VSVGGPAGTGGAIGVEAHAPSAKASARAPGMRKLKVELDR